MVKVAPSLLSSSLLNLETELKRIKDAGGDYAHVDCMDGHFVNNIAFGPSFVLQMAKTNIIDLDVHLMIENPLKFVDAFLPGCKIVTIHYETISNSEFFEIEKRVHSKNKLFGLSLRPNTHTIEILEYLKYVDVVLIMSVMPGFSGQKFIISVYDTIRYLNHYRKEKNLNYLIEVDGGVNESNYQSLIDEDVDIIVSGKFLFQGDMKKNIKLIKEYKKV